jgi:membrane-bound lytic murein transglycosylase F
MSKAFLLVTFFALISLAGCTPLGENVVRKMSIPDDAPRVQKVASGYAESFGQAESLDPRAKSIIHSYGGTIRGFAQRYGFDWRLVVAVMKVESGFEPEAVSEKGAQGLMQLMPVTGEELGRKLDLEDITEPRSNIHGGMFYLKRLYDLFDGADQADRMKLALAAYNAGVGRVYDAQELAAYLHDDPTKWQSVRDALPLLSKRYYTLHENVWKNGSPKFGWFGESQQTLAYVQKIMDSYERYKLLLN